MSYMFTNAGEKPCKRGHCNRCGKCLQNCRLKDTQILPQWGEAIFGRKIVSFVSKCILHQHPETLPLSVKYPFLALKNLFFYCWVKFGWLIIWQKIIFTNPVANKFWSAFDPIRISGSISTGGLLHSLTSLWNKSYPLSEDGCMSKTLVVARTTLWPGL